MAVFFLFFFGRFILAQQIGCFSSTAIPVAVSVNFPADKKPFCSGRLLHVDEDATLLSVLLVALGDNKSLNYTLRILGRFAAVSPFCFGYPAQPDIAS